jgi:hypothetical protein
LNLKLIPLYIFFTAILISLFRFVNFNSLVFNFFNLNSFILVLLIFKFYFTFNLIFIFYFLFFYYFIKFIKLNNNKIILLAFFFSNSFFVLFLFLFLLNFNKFENLLNFYFSKFLQRKLFFDIFLNRVFAIPLYFVYYFFAFYLIDRGILQNLIEFFSLKFNLKVKNVTLVRSNFNLFENKLKKNLYFYYFLIFFFVFFFLFFLFNLKKNVFFY